MEIVQVRARTEPTTCPGDDQSLDLGIGRQFGDDVAQPIHELAVDRIQGLGPVEHDVRDAFGDADLHDRHHASPLDDSGRVLLTDTSGEPAADLIGT
ncbi:hypothetical protein JCM18899A_53310 [Nocardioides sp. AN3]